MKIILQLNAAVCEPVSIFFCWKSLGILWQLTTYFRHLLDPAGEIALRLRVGPDVGRPEPHVFQGC